MWVSTLPVGDVVLQHKQTTTRPIPTEQYTTSFTSAVLLLQKTGQTDWTPRMTYIDTE